MTTRIRGYLLPSFPNFIEFCRPENPSEGVAIFRATNGRIAMEFSDGFGGHKETVEEMEAVLADRFTKFVGYDLLPSQMISADLAPELDALVELQVISPAKRNRVVARLLTPAGAKAAHDYRENGMRISEIADLLLAIS